MPKILICDDDEIILRAVNFKMQKEGYETVTASNGQEAVEYASKENFDLIILDVMMPKMDGYEALRELRKKEETKNTPVIMLTAKSQEDDVVKGLDLGADDYITKPFSLKEVAARVKRILARQGK